MRLDQRVEMSGTTRMRAGDSTATVVTTLLVISRTFVERRDTRRARCCSRPRIRLRHRAPAPTRWTDGDATRAARCRASGFVFASRRMVRPRFVGGDVAGNARAQRAVRADAGDASEHAGRGGPELVARDARTDRTALRPNGRRQAPGDVQARFAVAKRRPGLRLARRHAEPTTDRRRIGWATLTMSGSMTGGLVIDRRLGWISDARMTLHRSLDGDADLRRARLPRCDFG